MEKRTELTIQLKNLFDKVLQNIGWNDTKKPFGVSVGIENPENDDDIHLRVADFYIMITRFEPLVYELCKLTTIRGCYTLPNGDPGYPNTEDIVEVGNFNTPYQVINAVIADLTREFIEASLEETFDFEEPPDTD